MTAARHRQGKGRGPIPEPGELQGPDSSILVSTINAQLDRCTGEIARRSTTQQTLQAGTISAVAAIGAAILSGLSPLSLLLVPLICVSFGSLWIDNHRTIHRIGGYVRTELEPALDRVLASQGSGPYWWESYLKRNGRTEGRWSWSLPVLGVFYGLSFAALIIAFPSSMLAPADAAPPELPLLSIQFWPRMLWVLDLVLTVVGLFVGTRALLFETARSHAQ